jgi:hypothetical protein
MQGSFDNPPVVVRASRWTAMWMLAVSILFVGGFILMLRDPRLKEPWQVIAACASALLFGFGIAALARGLLRPSTLEMTPSGLVWRGTFRTTSFPWSDIKDFRPYRPSPRVISRHVGFDFAGQAENRRVVQAARWLTGVGGSLGGGWELDAAELSELLNSARTRWVASNSQIIQS